MNFLLTFVLWISLVGSPLKVAAYQQSTPISITSSLVLAWSPVDNADTYNVKRSGVHLGPYSTIATGVSVPTYTDSTVGPKTTYFYVVSAVNSVGESSNSTETQGTTP